MLETNVWVLFAQVEYKGIFDAEDIKEQAQASSVRLVVPFSQENGEEIFQNSLLKVSHAHAYMHACMHTLVLVSALFKLYIYIYMYISLKSDH